MTADPPETPPEPEPQPEPEGGEQNTGYENPTEEGVEDDGAAVG